MAIKLAKVKSRKSVSSPCSDLSTNKSLNLTIGYMRSVLESSKKYIQPLFCHQSSIYQDNNLSELI